MKFMIISLVSAMLALEAAALPSKIEVQVKRQAASGVIDPPSAGFPASGIIATSSVGYLTSTVSASSILYPTATVSPGGPGFLLVCYPQYGAYPLPTASDLPVGSAVPISDYIGSAIASSSIDFEGGVTSSLAATPAPGTVTASAVPSVGYPAPSPVAPYLCYPYGGDNSTTPVYPTANATSIAFPAPTIAPSYSEFTLVPSASISA